MLSAKDKNIFIKTMTKILINRGAVKSDHKDYDYDVGDFKVKIDPTDVLYFLFIKEGEGKEFTMYCSNEENMYSRIKHLIKS
jgi:hypothetical protein